MRYLLLFVQLLNRNRLVSFSAGFFAAIFEEAMFAGAKQVGGRCQQVVEGGVDEFEVGGVALRMLLEDGSLSLDVDISSGFAETADLDHGLLLGLGRLRVPVFLKP